MLSLGSNFFSRYFGFHLRIASENFIHSQISNSYLLWVFWKYGQPLSAVFLLGLVAYLWILLTKNKNDYWRPVLRSGGFCLLTIICIVMIFTISKTRLVTYWIPTYPFMAIFLGAIYAGTLDQIKKPQKNILRILAILIILGNFAFAANEAWFASKLYITKVAVEEKQIGLVLAKTSRPAYLYEHPHDQTIQYYAQRKITHLTAEENITPETPFYMVIPTKLIPQNRWLEDFITLYKGADLTLFGVE